MKPFKRAARVGGQIQKVLSEILQKESKDPRLDMVTVTDVKMSADLKYARIYYVVSGTGQDREAAAAGFESAKGFFRRTLAQQLELRYMPEIRFYYDESFDYGTRIENTLKKLHGPDAENHSAAEEE